MSFGIEIVCIVTFSGTPFTSAWLQQKTSLNSQRRLLLVVSSSWVRLSTGLECSPRLSWPLWLVRGYWNWSQGLMSSWFSWEKQLCKGSAYIARNGGKVDINIFYQFCQWLFRLNKGCRLWAGKFPLHPTSLLCIGTVDSLWNSGGTMSFTATEVLPGKVLI